MALWSNVYEIDIRFELDTAMLERNHFLKEVSKTEGRNTGLQRTYPYSGQRNVQNGTGEMLNLTNCRWREVTWLQPVVPERDYHLQLLRRKVTTKSKALSFKKSSVIHLSQASLSLAVASVPLPPLKVVLDFILAPRVHDPFVQHQN